MSIEFYYMSESPPCRTVEMVAGIAGVKLNLHHINLAEGEHLTEPFAKLNPAKKIPFIVDGDLKIGESRAIAAYISNKYLPVNNTLYPHDPVLRAKVDEALWFEGCSLYQSASLFLKPKLYGAKELDAEAEKSFCNNLKLLDDRLIANGDKYKYLLGNDITIADISIAAGMTFVEACDYDISKFEAVSSYLNKLKEDIPNYDEINGKAVENMRGFIKSRQG